MSESGKRVILLSASPKVDQSWAVSEILAKRGEMQLKNEQIDATLINVRHAIMHHETLPAFENMQEADAIVLVFPLYFFCLPGMLTRFLQDFSTKEAKEKKDCAVFAIVNCGFPEPELNLEAMRVVEQFTLQTGRVFGGGVMIGCGGMFISTQKAPFMKQVMAELDSVFERVRRYTEDSSSIEAKIIATAPKFPRKLYFFAGNAGWKSTARKNHLTRKDLYRTPYRQE
ncbi:MAG: NAD(P)H-dependent oxidoreductase [Eubacteriales bacterium]|nr:NAD(P)H-dependent oxidoreductase [Eubacteriales bacterium]